MILSIIVQKNDCTIICSIIARYAQSFAQSSAQSPRESNGDLESVVRVLVVVDGVDGVTYALDDSVETGVLVGLVGDDSLGAVWFDQAVFSLDLVSVTGLPLVLDVVVFQVMDGVVVVVYWVGLI